MADPVAALSRDEGGPVSRNQATAPVGVLTAHEWQRFTDFCLAELETGGPDHHRAVVVENMKGLGARHARWRAACYCATYELNTGAFIWEQWPAALDAVQAGRDQVKAWVTEHWDKLLWRRERRAARSRDKLTDCLMSSAEFVLDDCSDVTDFDTLWALSSRYVRYMGRYALIKLLETWRRAGATEAACPDIRPADGWSPRSALARLFPEHTALLVDGGDRPAVLEDINALAGEVRAALKAAAGTEPSWETVEILLCNYAVSVKNDAEYPGRRLDTDLANWFEAGRRWDRTPPLRFIDARAKLFPARCLGELNGWNQRRVELGTCYHQHGYHWSDVRYDYRNTINLAEPVRWGAT